MTRPLPRSAIRRAKRNALFPDALEVLRRAEAINIRRACHLCGAEGSELVQMRSKDEWKCASNDRCGKRLRERG